ncbi:cytochrome p450 pisatin [Fusarium oxysporum f. sp. phaseoli]
MQIQTTMLKLQELFIGHRKVIDLPQFLQYYAFDVIGAIPIGESMGMMESNTDVHGTCRDIDAVWHHAAVVGLIPSLHPWIVRISTLLGLSAVTASLDKLIERQMRKYMEGKQPEGSEGTADATFMGALLKLQQKGKGTYEEIRLCLSINIMAGSYTTAISLSSILFYLYTHQDTLRQLRTELDEAAQKGIISDPIKFQEAQKLPYLQAVIKEGLRLHPGVGTQLTRVVPKGGIVIENQFFPERAEVGVNGWALYHNQSIFGEDASEFRPDRWLTTENEDLGAAGSFAFGAGPRSCIGKNVSMLELSKAIPQIVQNFDIWENNRWWFVQPKYKALVKRIR